MAEIIAFDDKLQLSKARQAELIRKRKILAVQKIFQCMHCALKCEKCGTQIKLPNQDQEDIPSDQKLPYRFCEGCAAEYKDYIRMLHGHVDTDCYWHNDAWLTTWKRWIDYQGSLDRYLKSEEFNMLVEELRQPLSEA